MHSLVCLLRLMIDFLFMCDEELPVVSRLNKAYKQQMKIAALPTLLQCESFYPIISLQQKSICNE